MMHVRVRYDAKQYDTIEMHSFTDDTAKAVKVLIVYIRLIAKENC